MWLMVMEGKGVSIKREIVDAVTCEMETDVTWGQETNITIDLRNLFDPRDRELIWVCP